MKKVFAALMAVVVAVSIVPLKANASAEQIMYITTAHTKPPTRRPACRV